MDKSKYLAPALEWCLLISCFAIILFIFIHPANLLPPPLRAATSGLAHPYSDDLRYEPPAFPWGALVEKEERGAEPEEGFIKESLLSWVLDTV